MALISKFDGTSVAGWNVLLLGDVQEKLRTARKIIQTWPEDAGALVVLDRSGDLFTSCAREEDILCSGIHEGGFMPDYVKPALLHPLIGSSPRMAAEYLCSVLSPMAKRLGTNDDAFWNPMGRKLNHELWLSQLVEFKSRCPANANMTLWIASNDRDLRNLQESILLHKPAANGPVTRPFENGHADLVRWLMAQGTLECGDSSPIYYDSLGRFAGKSTVTTGHCIVQTADTQMRAMRELFDAMGFFQELLLTASAFDLDAYANAPEGRAAFVPGWRRGRPTDTALARLALGGFAAAADNGGRPVTFLIPEVDQWDVTETIQYLSTRFGDAVRYITGVRSDSLFRAQAGVDANGAILDTLEDLSCVDVTLWHHSKNKSMKTAFDERAAADRMYGLDDLVEGMMAVEKDGSVQGYLMMEPVHLLGRKLTERRRRTDGALPWLLQDDPALAAIIPPAPPLPRTLPRAS